MNTNKAIGICGGTEPGDLRAAALKLLEHDREVALLYVDLIQWLGANSDALTKLPPEMFARMEAFQARMVREKVQS